MLGESLRGLCETLETEASGLSEAVEEEEEGGSKGGTDAEIQAERLTKAMELTEKTWFYLREIKAEILLKPPSEASWVFLSS